MLFIDHYIDLPTISKLWYRALLQINATEAVIFSRCLMKKLTISKLTALVYAELAN